MGVRAAPGRAVGDVPGGVPGLADLSWDEELGGLLARRLRGEDLQAQVTRWRAPGWRGRGGDGSGIQG